MRFFRVATCVTLTAALSWTAFASAQVGDADDESEDNDPGAPPAAGAEVPTEIPEELFRNPIMDEITVIAGPQGQTQFELRMEREELMRQRIYAEMRLREREQEEMVWRQADRDLRNPESRIKWGYSPQAEMRMRRENEFLYEKPGLETTPATLFRAEF